MTPSLLPALWAALGGDPAAPARLRVDGRTGLGSPLPVADLALSAVGTGLLAVAEHRGGDPAGLDAAHVGTDFRSERHVRLDGAPAGTGFAPLSRFLPTADGWVRLHANYPHHRAAVLRVLGDDPAAAALTRTAQQVEDDVVAAGGVAAAVRTEEQWRAHPQAAAAAPPVLARAGDAPPARREPAGLRVLDLTRVLAGPHGTRLLAAHGADVLRVEDPGLPEDPDTLLDTGPGKRSTLLDLRRAGDRAAFEELLAGADVLVQGYRPGALAAHGLGAEELAARRPGLVVVTLSAWGTAGPWGRRRGFDSIVQAATGIADALRGPDGAPGALPAQALDHAAGHLVAAAALRGLASRAAEGGTWHAELSLAGLAGLLLAAPRTAGDDGPEPAPDPYLVDLPSSRGTVTVVRPVGAPVWSHGVREPGAPVWRR